MYNHQWCTGQTIPLPIGKVVCIGRNYAEHARELGNDIPSSPLLFMKPASALLHLDRYLPIPQGFGACHVETEVALLIKKTLNKSSTVVLEDCVEAVGLALDLTLRDLQNKLKEKGHPWERAKAFDGACPITNWVPLNEVCWPLKFGLFIDGAIQQRGCSSNMLFQCEHLITEIIQSFSLQPGDVVLTGTPAGVTALHRGQLLTVFGFDRIKKTTEVVDA